VSEKGEPLGFLWLVGFLDNFLALGLLLSGGAVMSKAAAGFSASWKEVSPPPLVSWRAPFLVQPFCYRFGWVRGFVSVPRGPSGEV